jgi:hypothetical protein
VFIYRETKGLTTYDPRGSSELPGRPENTRKKRKKMTITIPDTIPDNMEMLGISDLTMEHFDGDMPCEAKKFGYDACKSDGELPATWLISHNDALPKCTLLICEPCVAHLQQWVAECVVMGGAYGFSCKQCRCSPFHYSNLITRQL